MAEGWRALVPPSPRHSGVHRRQQLTSRELQKIRAEVEDSALNDYCEKRRSRHDPQQRKAGLEEDPIVRTVIIVAITVLSAAPALAQNLLVNPGFDDADQLDGWTCTSDHGVASWSTEDRGGSAISGSMMHDVTATSNNRWLGCRQCVPVSAGSSYLVSGWYYWPNDPDVTQDGTPRFSVYFYSDATCTTGLASGATSNDFPIYDTWLAFTTSEMTAPAGAVAADIIFLTWQDLANDPVRARFDDLAFIPTLPIFSDGFESGDTTFWSNTVP
jgi:hypothetical protein